MLGRYLVLNELGRGGMGVVYQGHDPKLQRHVAIKLVLDRNDHGTTARVTREAQAVARLSHPNVVKIFDVGLSQGRPYIVMELIDGPTLARWSEERRHRWRATLDKLLRAGAGLEAAHQAGLIHRDFKPSNVMLDRTGEPKVLDFGLARSEGSTADAVARELIPFSTSTLTATGIALGTPAYMAPEQHRGARVRSTADIYAFAVACYEALYGFRPFTKGNSQWLFQQKREGPPQPPEKAPVPAAVFAVLRRALSFNANDRQDTMAELLGDLRSAAGSGPSPRRRALFAGAAVAGVIGVTVALSPSDEPEQATSLGPRIDPVAERNTRLLLDKADEQWGHGKRERAIGFAFASNVPAAASGSLETRGDAMRVLGMMLCSGFETHATGARILSEAAVLIEESGRGELAIRAFLDLSSSHYGYGRREDAAAAARQARAVATRLDLGLDHPIELELMVNQALVSADETEQERILFAAVEHARKHPSPANLPHEVALFYRLGLRFLSKDIERSRDYLLIAEQKSRLTKLDQIGGTPQIRMLLADVERLRGNSSGCVRRIESTLKDYPDSVAFDSMTILKGVCLHALERHEDALAAAAFAKDHIRSQGQLIGSRALRMADVLELEGVALLALGRLDEAEKAHHETLVLIESFPRKEPRHLAETAYHLGNIESLRGNAEAAATWYRRGLGSLGSLPDFIGGALRLRLGINLARRGKPAEALPYLESEAPGSGTEASRRERATATGYRARVLWELFPKRRGEALEIAIAARELLASDDLRHRKQDALPGGEPLAELDAWIASRRNEQ